MAAACADPSSSRNITTLEKKINQTMHLSGKVFFLIVTDVLREWNCEFKTCESDWSAGITYASSRYVKWTANTFFTLVSGNM